MRTTHGACGREWDQRGNQTGHCSQCHETFSSLTAFEKHQTIIDGKVTCHPPRRVGLVDRVDRYGTIQWGQPTPLYFQDRPPVV